MAGFSLAKGFDRAGLARIADALVVTIAVSLPWSTSVTAILLVLWLIIELPTLDWADVRRAVMTPAGWLRKRGTTSVYSPSSSTETFSHG